MYTILSWQPLLRPPLPNEFPAVDPNALDVPLKALSCRNQIVSMMALLTANEPVENAGLVFSDLASEHGRIPASAISYFLVGTAPTPEAGEVCDPLYSVDEFNIDKSAAVYIKIKVPETIRAGTYYGTVALLIDGDDVVSNNIEIEVADVDLPDVYNWSFFLNVWMNPATIARWHGVDMWSQEHFEAMRPYIRDLAEHGQKTVVAPISYQPWGTQTRDPYPNLISWTKVGDKFEYDFSNFDEYIRLHEDEGIDRAIHCYSIVSGPGAVDKSTIEYRDTESGEMVQLVMTVGDEQYVAVWSDLLSAFSRHLVKKGWLNKTYIAFDEKPDQVMDRLLDFVNKHASEFRVSLAGNTRDDLLGVMDDISLLIKYDERGVEQKSPSERASIGVTQLLEPFKKCALSGGCQDKMITTFYVCCEPAFPNTFIHSPLVESRMLPFLALQGGYDGFLRWSYNDWPDDPYKQPEWGPWPTGDTFFVYPGEDGPVSSLRWEQLREGIQDFELAMIASANIQTPDEMVDYEQAVTLACRNPDGREKSIGDIEIARRLLIPIAQHQNE